MQGQNICSENISLYVKKVIFYSMNSILIYVNLICWLYTRDSWFGQNIKVRERYIKINKNWENKTWVKSVILVFPQLVLLT